MQEYMKQLEKSLRDILSTKENFHLHSYEWKDNRSGEVAIWINYKNDVKIFACDIGGLDSSNKDYFSVTFFWRTENDLTSESDAEIASLCYWQCHSIARLGYLPVEAEKGRYRLGKLYDKRKISICEVTWEIMEVFNSFSMFWSKDKECAPVKNDNE